MAKAGKPRRTVRFTQVVKRCGRPKVHILWLTPEKDPELQRAREAQRVMMVTSRAGGGKAEVGSIGFDPATARGAQLLVFPKSLQAFADARVVGIKFDLVQQPELAPASEDASRPVPKKRPRPHQPATQPVARETVDRGPSAKGPKRKREDNHERRTPVQSPAQPARPARSPPPDRAAFTHDRENHGRERSKPAHRKPAPTPPRSEKTRVADWELLREVRAALKELHDGKAVAAYQRLERAAAAAAAPGPES